MSTNSAHIVNYSRINPDSGSGFILRRLFEYGPMTKRAVYLATARYVTWVPGYHSSLWAKLLDDGLIVADGGRAHVSCPRSYWRCKEHSTLRAFGKSCAPVYSITEKGKRIYAEMLVRCNEKA